MILPGERVIAGVSGGADSVCLLAVLREYRARCAFELTVVHVEHGIRGEDSLADAAFVERLCREWQVPCFVEHVDVPGRVRLSGESWEEAARELRYEVFEEYCGRLGARRIAVAHNQNDQAETVLLNLVRGSGLKGMGGMLPAREKIIRPLLSVSRREIEEWLEQKGISYCTDQTNLETDYTRNKLRLEILPLLEQELNREAVKHIAGTALHLQKAEAYLQRQAEAVYKRCVQFEGMEENELTISLEAFLEAEELMQEYVLRMSIQRLLQERGLKDFTAFHIAELKRLAGMPCGKQMDFPGGLRAFRRRQELVLRSSGERAEVEKCSAALSESGIYCLMGHTFSVEYMEKPENMKSFPEKKYTKWLAYDTIKHNVCLRTRQTGDYLIVNREGGRKKLKDYLIDQKVPREERDRLLLVAEGSHILWVVGGRISEAAKVTEDKKKLLKIQMMEDEV